MKKCLIGLAGAAIVASAAAAQDVTLRLHQFLPSQATLPSQVLVPWGEDLAVATDGRLRIEHYDAMTLGGRPGDLYDQARDGVVDIIMTVTGYTPGRFPASEVFELPFMMRGSVATSQAFWTIVDEDLQDTEYRDTVILGAWVHGDGVIHSDSPITSLEDMAGQKLRGPTRVVNDLLDELGAVPVGMPLPAVPENLSKGVIDGTVVPWEVTPALRLSELVGHATEFEGEAALYTATFVMAMNRRAYEGLPDDLRSALDARSGMALTVRAAESMLAGDAPARELAIRNGTEITVLPPDEVAKWREAAAPVVDRWIASAEDRGLDGAALMERAEGLIDSFRE